MRQAEAGVPVAELCRKIGVSEQTLYRWKTKFAGMGIVEMRWVKQLEDENRRLTNLVADLTLDKHMLQEVLRKRPEARSPSGTRSLARGRVPHQPATGLQAGRARPVDFLLEEQGEGPDPTAEAPPGARGGTAALRISAPPRAGPA